MNVLEFTPNRYGGVCVDSHHLPKSVEAFESALVESLAAWEKQFKVVWISVSADKAALLTVLYQHGFENHHCDKAKIMLTKKLQQNALVPEYANHTIGIGGLVINDKQELLTIREQGHINTHPHNWKFPGGMIDPFEHIEDAVKREVFEETGIETVFESFIGFRHHHIGQFKTSNIYGVCRLKPISSKISIQESEIYDARWFPINDYLADEKIGQYNKFILRSALKSPGLKSIKLPGYMESEEEYEVFINIDE
ncbi:NUDIX domain-containing protein [Aliikangiella marina]|uniref:NUDIX domain-containing protein n=2 Tax=Aliikangiella marina TaxID=1712262 RepID=A0A545T391_9GAMM|nr:NUDIX domain-containing protein [Aliikangiella marina]